MTLWAFVSDIHGNSPALLSVEGWCEARGVQRYVCLGDVIGRGDPDGCVRWVRDHATIAIVGNRDLDYLERVVPGLQALVRSWPHEARASDFVVSHGDPRLHRILGSHAIRARFTRASSYMEMIGARLWLFGHTHHARVWRLSGRESAQVVDRSMRLNTFDRYVVNVGTIGMPLPGRGKASFVLYDDVAGDVEVVSVADIGQAAAKRAAILVS